MRHTVTLQTTLHALIATSLLLAVLPARAEDAPVVVSIVTGLAPGDLLNIRAQPSPTGKTEARLPDGASVQNLGCNDVDGHQWCKIEDLDNPKVSGWAPARYLTPTNPQAVADANSVIAPDQPPAGPPPNLAARLGDADQTTDPESTLKSADAIGKTAMQDAYRVAVAIENPSTGEPPPAGDAVSCARYVGQPMTTCEASVVRVGNIANVTVTWPDGGTRVISFNEGLPAGSDTQGEFRFTREGSLNMIRVGVSERFEITDALTLGN